MTQILNKHVIVEENRIAYGIHGVGEPVVLLHGTPASSIVWRNVIPKLCDAGYQVHLYDLLGYGASERPVNPAIDTSISAQVPILEKMLNHWGLGRVHLVGHDYGGGIAQRFSIFSPGRIRTLSLIDTVCFDSSPSEQAQKQLNAGLEQMIRIPAAEHRAHFRNWILNAVQNKDKFAREVLETYLDMICGPVGQASYFQHQARHYDKKHMMEVSNRLAELQEIPVQILWGDNDEWLPCEWGRKLHSAIPGSMLTILKGAGHFSQEDQPQEVAKRLLAFFTKGGV
ncbi:alpha/beta fold hydrolase [Sneathiella glossodoripedis]|uniref:alpha/beta fold hydrolase n=1 Tax=Sneathiella glossodoripedis TaxID=418853 RepID=UPI0004716E34|nr:alpha/beta hydrolase [Sneathiella glossodoripedis]